MTNGKVINLSDRMKEKVFCRSKTLLLRAEEQGMKLDFSMKRLKRLNNDLYTIYQYHQRIYFYEEEMDLVITNALLKKMESENKILKVEDILDSVWDVTVKKEKIVTRKNKCLSKVYQIL